MHSRDMEYIVGLLKNGKDAEAILSVRRKLNMAFLARTTDLSGKLPVLAFGSTFKKNGDGIQLRRYNGYVLLEVNGLESQSEAEAVRREAAALPQTLLAFVGLSGRSVKIVVPFVLPDGSLPKKEEQARMFHAAAYQLAVRHYQPQLGSIISLKEPFLSRGCRMSVDPDAYYNPDAVAIRIEQPLQMPDGGDLKIVPSPVRDPLEMMAPGADRNGQIATLFSVVAIRIEQPLQMPDGGDLKIVPSPVRDPLEMMAPGADRNGQIATLFSVILMEMTRRFSESPEDDIQLLFIDLAQACCRLGIPEEEAVGWTLRYEALKKYKIDVRMAFRTAYTLENVSNRAEPLSSVPPSMSLVLRLDEFMNRRYFFRTNEMSGGVEYLDRSMIQFVYKPYTTKVRNSICLEAQQEGLNVWDKDIDRYVNSDRVPIYHPIDHFLGNLPAWDGKERIRALAGRVPCDNPIWGDLFYRWFLSMVAHWMELDSEHGNSTTPLLVGGQGCGKSTFCLNLLPPVLRPYYTDSIDFGNRRGAELALHRYALINIDEFDSVKSSHQSFLKHILQKAVVNTRLPYQSASRNLRRYATFIATSNNYDLLTKSSHQSFLKHILQKAVVNTRLPYQSASRNLRRYATFIATSNNYDLLTDPTGSRRFICVEVKGRIDYAQPIDYDQLYAEAKELLRRGERFWFTPEEEALITENNRDFQQQPAEEQLFLRYFKIAEDIEEAKPLLASEILDMIAEKQPGFNITKTMILNFGKLLKRNSVPNKRTMRGTCYYVEEVDG